jgi:hypothetical protein
LSYEKKNVFKKTVFLNLRFLKMGKIGTYISGKNFFFADSRKKFPQLYGKSTKIAFKKCLDQNFAWEYRTGYIFSAHCKSSDVSLTLQGLTEISDLTETKKVPLKWQS